MPSTHIVRECDIHRSGRVMQLEGMFDVPVKDKTRMEWRVNLPIESEPWSIGLIVGPSGSGKTTVARELFGDDIIDQFDWPTDKSIIDSFPADLGIRDVVEYLTSVGFNSPPSWLRPFSVLSNGEKFRVMIARALAESKERIGIDEFTSVVDRQVAKVACHSVQKTIRRKKKQLVAISCHYDIIDWLQPDWVYEPDCDRFTRRLVRRHPELKLEIHHVHHSTWGMFRHHHYLSGHLFTGSRRFCFGAFLDGKCIAFAAIRKLPHPKARNVMMGHRLVVLPDYQGLGIGGRFDDWLGQFLYDRGFRYHNTVQHPAMIAYYEASPRWQCIGRIKRLPPRVRTFNKRTQSVATLAVNPRLLSTRSYEYKPPKSQG